MVAIVHLTHHELWIVVTNADLNILSSLLAMVKTVELELVCAIVSIQPKWLGLKLVWVFLV
jgi:hypothetical protein